MLAKALMLVLLTGVAAGPIAMAEDMPHAAGSPSAGITFDDRPLLLPVQRNFQMAMLTASSELGRTCGHMEAYGWRMAPNEQQRVNQVFNNTVDRLRAQGYSIEAKAPSSVSRDVTIFTGDRPDKHLIFMWSAGEIGLVMVLCETSAPIASTPKMPELTQAMTPPPSRYTTESRLALKKTEKSEAPVPLSLTRTGKPAVDFSPEGDWSGTYTCYQGTTGATLHIAKVKGDQFEGVFRFYPTPKNPYVEKGSYKVFGEFDRDSQRILINPGQWIEHPKDYDNTIMIGSFDPAVKTFSGYFQGINGCTSFEARYSTDSDAAGVSKAGKAAKTAKKKAVKKKAKPVAEDLSQTPKQDALATSGSGRVTGGAGEKADAVAKPSGMGGGVVEPSPGIDLGAPVAAPSVPPYPTDLMPKQVAPEPALTSEPKQQESRLPVIDLPVAGSTGTAAPTPMAAPSPPPAAVSPTAPEEKKSLAKEILKNLGF